MIVLVFFILGGVVGAVAAKRRKGETLDILQYAAGYAIASGICGYILTLMVARLVGG